MTNQFPPANFRPTKSTIEGIEVYEPYTPQEEHQPVVSFNCPQCHAQTAYSAAGGGLTCANCGYYEPPQRQIVGKGAEDFEFTVETMQRSAQGWGEARKELQCQNCGVYTSVSLDSLTHTCPFCGSNKVIQKEAPQDVLRPRFVIPFKLDEPACRPIVREWLGSSWMVPKSLRNLASLGHFNGVYFPYWTFDAHNYATWRAEVGHRKTYRSGGKTRTKTVWKWESGTVKRFVDDMLLSGTSRLSKLLLKKINNFDLRQLAPYEPKYLAGFQAQAYDIPLEQAWERARQQMREETRKQCRSQASTSRIRNFSMQLKFEDETWRYILLPVYIIPYTYRDKTYQVMINGQTGKIAGQRPVDWLKVWLAIAAIFVPAFIAVVVGLILNYATGQANCLVMLGFILFGLGAAGAIKLIVDAQKLDDA